MSTNGPCECMSLYPHKMSIKLPVTLFFLVTVLITGQAQAQQVYNIEGQNVSRDFVVRLNSMASLVNDGKYDEALPAVLSLIKENGNIPSLHWNYAKILYQKGDYQRAYFEARQASTMSPSTANFYITLGNAALKAGKKRESLEALRTYLKLDPGSSNATMVRDFIKTIETEVVVEKPGEAVSPPGTYLAEATIRGVTHWAQDKMPLKVHIATTAIEPQYLEAVKNAFKTWQFRSDDLVSFLFVPEGSHADIYVNFTDDSTKLASPIEGAVTNFRDGSAGRISSTTLILTRRDGKPISISQMQSIALHEIGHALGINGHSSDSKDIMFMSVDKNQTTLSRRDVETLKAMYKLKPGLLKP